MIFCKMEVVWCHRRHRRRLGGGSARDRISVQRLYDARDGSDRQSRGQASLHDGWPGQGAGRDQSADLHRDRHGRPALAEP